MKAKIILSLFMIIGLCSCQKPTNNYDKYVTSLEINANLMNAQRDVDLAEMELESAEGSVDHANFYKPGEPFYSKEKVDAAESKLVEAKEEYVRALGVYSEALNNILTYYSENPTDTVEYQKEIAVVTYKISTNDYNYYKSKLEKIQKEIEKNK